jgi:hypothetical protein
MLIMICYILFFAISDMLIYFLLYKTFPVSTKVWTSYGIILVFIILLHSGLFDVKFLIPFGRLLLLLASLGFNFFYYLMYKIAKDRVNRTTDDENDNDNLLVRYIRFIRMLASFSLSYIFPTAVFIVQCNLISDFIKDLNK